MRLVHSECLATRVNTIILEFLIFAIATGHNWKILESGELPLKTAFFGISKYR